MWSYVVITFGLVAGAPSIAHQYHLSPHGEVLYLDIDSLPTLSICDSPSESINCSLATHRASLLAVPHHKFPKLFLTASADPTRART